MDKKIQPYGYVTVDISGVCNAKCKYCATGARSANPGGMMSLELFKKTLDRLMELGAVEVGKTSTIGLFNKGEPFLNPDFSEILDYIISKNLPFSLSSNFNVYKKMTRKQIDACTGIIVSVPGWSQESYDKVHKFDFEHIKENILKFLKDFKDAGQANKLFLTYHLYQYNLDELPLAIDFAKSNKMSFGSYYAHIIDYWKIKNYVENKLDDETLKDINNSVFINHLTNGLSNVPSDYICPQHGSLNIDEKANILACCVLPNNIEGYSLGNLFDENAKELILNRQKIKECDYCIKSGISKLMHTYGDMPLFVKRLNEQAVLAPKKKKNIFKKIFNKG